MTPTVVLMVVGIVLLGAALVIPDQAPSAVPTGLLEPVSTPAPTGASTADRNRASDATNPSGATGSRGAETEVGLSPTSPDDDLWVATDAEDGAVAAKAKRSGDTLEGSSAASVTGDDLEQAERDEAERATEARKARNRATARKENRERKTARARAAARQRAAHRRRAAARPAPQQAPPAPSAAPTRPRAPAAAPRASAPAKRAPARRSPSRSAVADEFTGGL